MDPMSEASRSKSHRFQQNENLNQNIMMETDKFEIKSLADISVQLQEIATFSRNQTLKQCKAVIKQLDLALKQEIINHSITNKKYIEAINLNEKLSQTLNQQSVTNMTEKSKLQSQIAKLQSDKLCAIQQSRSLSNQIKELENLQKDLKISRDTLKQEVEHLKICINSKNQEVAAVQNTKKLITQQNKKLKMLLVEREHEQEQGLVQLKKIGNEVINQYGQLSQAYDTYSKKFRDSQTTRISPFELTPQKNCNNLAPNSHKQEFDKTRNPETSPRYNRSFSSMNKTQHSEDKHKKLNEEIKKIKQQVANQYRLVNLKQEAYSKQRVESTLSNLKEKVNNYIMMKQRI